MAEIRSAEEVLHRALVLSELVWRAQQEREGLAGSPEEGLARLEAAGALDAAHADEMEALATERGRLPGQLVNQLTWLCEPLYMLLWTLNLADEPLVEEDVSIPAALRLLTGERPGAPALRPAAEIEAALRRWFWVHRRVYAFVRAPGPLDLAGWIARSPGEPPEGLAFAGSDLLFRGQPLGEREVLDLPYGPDYPLVTGGRLRALRWACAPDIPWFAVGDNPYDPGAFPPPHKALLYLEGADAPAPASGWDARGGGAPHRAAFLGDEAALDALIAAGQDLAARDIDGDTPLTCAIAGRAVGCAARLLDAGADIQAAGGDRRSPLGAAIHGQDEAMARLLLERGADPRQGGPGQPPLIFCAIGTGDPAFVRLLLERGADVEEPNEGYLRPLRFAQEIQARRCVMALIEAGADVHARDQRQQSSLHWAASTGDLGAAQALVARGVPLESRSVTGYTPLLLAFTNNHPEVARWLMAQGADLRAATPSGRTPLHMAASNGDADLAGEALAAGLDLEAKADNGLTPLMMAIGGGHPAAAARLLAAGADPDARDAQGFSALHWAVAMGQAELVRQLLAAGANPAAQDPGGLTPLQRAEASGLDEIAALLRA